MMIKEGATQAPQGRDLAFSLVCILSAYSSTIHEFHRSA